MRAHAALLSIALLASGCVRLGYGATNAEDPVPPRLLAALHPHQDDLTSCLHSLGAPQFVWDYTLRPNGAPSHERQHGIALGWVSEDATDWDLDMSYTVTKFGSAAMSFDWDDSDLYGVVLWFDGDLKLEQWKQGRMRDLTSGLRQRPATDDLGG